jgi:signal transduction histidine kinase
LIVGEPVGRVVLQADEGRLEHLFVNLLMNALQATPEGGTVWIEYGEDRSDVEIRVRDTGSGIAPELMTGLFKPFSTTKPDGFGLGLYSCQCIVQDHGGDIQVDSGENGTVFVVRLPRAL